MDYTPDEYEVPMKLEFNVIVTVQADSPEEAIHMAEAAAFIDDGMARGELCNWEVTGRPREAEV